MGRHTAACELQVTDCGLPEFLAIAARFGTHRYAFAVTPNTDHLIRFRTDQAFRDIYRQAEFVLLDSRFIARLLRRTGGVILPTCTGSTLTAELFGRVIGAQDPLVLIGGSAQQADRLRPRYRLERLQHHKPPMGFVHDPLAVESCLRFIEAASPFRFCFLAVGCPQQEQLAHLLWARGRARGLALCVGGAVNFLTGAERRAPRWMQSAGLEWLYRLSRDPARLARRYLVRGPRIFWLLPRLNFLLRSPSITPSG